MDNQSNYQTTVDLFKAIIWPAFAFTLLISFWSPLDKTLEKIPSIIDKSESITIAGLSLKIERGIGIKPSSEVKSVLSQISPDGIKKLMNNKNSSYYDSKDWPKNDNEELFRLKLVKEIPTKGSKHKFAMQPTLLGIKCQKFLDAVMIEIVKQIAQNTSNLTKASSGTR